MSCFHPMIAMKDEFRKSIKHSERNKEGKKIYVSNEYVYNKPKYRFIGKLEDIGDWKDIKEKYEDLDPILLPCGKCKGCRLDISRKWADRMCLEYDHTKKAVFLTLTYDDEHLHFSDSGYPTLVKKDMSDFMKNLRGNKYYDKKQIRFYGSGEYGDRTKRPHMHIILFGLELDDFTDGRFYGEFHVPEWFVGKTDHKLYYAGKNELKQFYWRSPHLDNVIWKKGRVCVSEFSWQTAAYVARYVRKKLDGPLEDFYGDIEPPFALMSRRPGIAGYFIEDHPEKDFFEEIGFSFNGKIRPIPDFVFDKLENIDRDHYFVYHAVKDQRKKYAEDNMLLKLQQTDLSYEGLLAVEEDKLNRVSTTLKRPLE